MKLLDTSVSFTAQAVKLFAQAQRSEAGTKSSVRSPV